MPAQPAWFHRLEEILEELQFITEPYLDRLAVQKLFKVKERRARQLMEGVAGIQLGNAVAISRVALLTKLEEQAKGEPVQQEVRRRTRVAEELDRTRRSLAARRVRIPVSSNPATCFLKDLSSAIQLEPGSLSIQFNGAEDLAAKLFELSQAMMNDWPDFSRAVDR